MSCGGKTVQSKNKHTCTICNKTFYDNPKAAVVVMLYTSDKKHLILSRRAHEPEAGKIDFIGGFLDVGETFEQAAYREMQEESGLAATDIGVLRYVTSIYNGYAWEGSVLPTTSVCFMAELKDGSRLIAADDVSSFETFAIDALPTNEECAWDDMPRVLTETAQLLSAM